MSDTSSLSDTESDYQDVGPPSPPLSPVVIIKTQNKKPQMQMTGVTARASVKTRSVSCDTNDIQVPAQYSVNESYNLKPIALQGDQGYYTSTPYPSGSGAQADKTSIQFQTTNPMPQNLMTNKDWNVNQSVVGNGESRDILVPNTPNITPGQSMNASQGTSTGYIPETPYSIDYHTSKYNSTNYSSTANSASTSVMGLTGSGQIDPKVSPSYPMQTQTPNAKPKMATVSFDPQVTYQNPPASNGNEYWSMNNPNAYAAQNFFGSQVSPVAPVTTMHSQVQARNSEMSHVSRDNMPSTSQSLPYPSDNSYYRPSNPTQVSGEIEHGFASLNLNSLGQGMGQTNQMPTSDYSGYTPYNPAPGNQSQTYVGSPLGMQGANPQTYPPQTWASNVGTQAPAVQNVPTTRYTHGQDAQLNYASPGVAQGGMVYPGQVKSKTLEPDSFEGSDKGPEILEYLIHFEQIAIWNCWTPDQKARMLSIKLKGEAQKLLSTLTQAQLVDYESLKQALIQRFNPKERQLAYRCEFRNRKRQQNENPLDFGLALRRLGQKAYPDMPGESLEVHLVEQYIGGLGSFDLQKHVQLQHPKNLEQAVNLAIEYTAICNNDFGKTMKPSLTAEDQISAVTSLRPLESNTEKDYEKSIAQILDRLLNEREKAYGSDRSNRPYHNPTAGNRSPSPNPDARGYRKKNVSFNDEATPKYSPRKIVCTYCGKYNHTINFCRKKKADDERQQAQKPNLN